MWLKRRRRQNSFIWSVSKCLLDLLPVSYCCTWHRIDDADPVVVFHVVPEYWSDDKQSRLALRLELLRHGPLLDHRPSPLNHPELLEKLYKVVFYFNFKK